MVREQPAALSLKLRSARAMGEPARCETDNPQHDFLALRLIDDHSAQCQLKTRFKKIVRVLGIFTDLFTKR